MSRGFLVCIMCSSKPIARLFSICSAEKDPKQTGMANLDLLAGSFKSVQALLIPFNAVIRGKNK